MSAAAQPAGIASQQRAIEQRLRLHRERLNGTLDGYAYPVRAMLQYIHEHLFEEQLTAERVVRASGSANHNIRTSFHRAVGMMIREYIARERLSVAASILKDLDVDVYALAAAVGYSEEWFSKLFKKAYGCSPLTYQRQERSKHNGQETSTRNSDKR